MSLYLICNLSSAKGARIARSEQNLQQKRKMFSSCAVQQLRALLVAFMKITITLAPSALLPIEPPKYTQSTLLPPPPYFLPCVVPGFQAGCTASHSHFLKGHHTGPALHLHLYCLSAHYFPLPLRVTSIFHSTF